MYSTDWTAIFGRSRKHSPTTAPAGASVPVHWLGRISPTVWALGLTSFLTDVSSEMVASVLPMYLVLQLGISPVAFGLIDGLYQGMGALVRVVGGVLADRSRRYKELAAIGYGISAACRLLILAAGAAWTTIAGVVAVDRIGKGLRTAPRDALIALRSPSDDLATAFGVHRALDAGGALIGPVVAFVLLARMRGAFDVLFVVSFVVAVLGAAAILLFVEPVTGAELHADAVVDSTGTHGVRTLLMDPRLRGLTITAFLLALATISDSFLFLSLQSNLGSAATAFPLFYVATSLSTALLAIPAGRAADAAGRTGILLLGYSFLAIAYVLAQLAGSLWSVGLCVLLLGAYYAATDGVLTAIAAADLPAAVRGSGLALLSTVVNVARFLSSVAFGALWVAIGVRAATWVYFACLIGAIAGSSILLMAAGRRASSGDRVDGFS